MVEVEIEARPSPGGQVAARARPDAAARSSVDAARRAARALQIVACSIVATSVLGFVLSSFWPYEDGSFASGPSVRQRIGDLLVFAWIPLAIAALVYAASFFLLLQAARVELDSARSDVSPTT